MAWNEPGKGSRDPWSKPPSRPPAGGGGGLAALWRRVRAHLGKLPKGRGGLSGLLLAVVIAWLLVSCHIYIQPGQTGVVQRLGQYTRSLGPGFHLRWPRPFETVTRLDMNTLHADSGSLEVLTRDSGLVNVPYTLQYQIADAKQFLFASAMPELVLRNALETALRAAIGQLTLDQVLALHGGELAARLRAQVQQQLDRHPPGLQLMSLQLQEITPPAAVHDAYAAIGAAREDGRSAAEQARSEAAKLQASAQLEAQRLLETAQAEQAASLARAQAQVAGFEALLPAYRQNPGLTRHTLWLAATTRILAANAKVVDSTGQTMIHLSLGGRSPAPAPAASTAAAPEAKDKQS